MGKEKNKYFGINAYANILNFCRLKNSLLPERLKMRATLLLPFWPTRKQASVTNSLRKIECNSKTA